MFAHSRFLFIRDAHWASWSYNKVPRVPSINEVDPLRWWLVQFLLQCPTFKRLCVFPQSSSLAEPLMFFIPSTRLNSAEWIVLRERWSCSGHLVYLKLIMESFRRLLNIYFLAWSTAMTAREHNIPFNYYLQVLSMGFLGACLLHR